MSDTTVILPNVLTRRQKQQRRRGVAFYDAAEGILLAEGGARIIFTPHTPLSAILRIVAAIQDCRVIYRVAGTASDMPARQAYEYHREPARDGWRVTYRHDSPPRRTAVYQREDSEGRTTRIDLRSTSAWFSDADDIDAMRRAYLTLETRLRNSFGQQAQLWGSPAQTGLDLLDRSLPFGASYPTLEPEVRRWFYLSPQARKELFTAPLPPTIPGLHGYDARLAYAGKCRHVPIAVENMGAGPYVPGRPGRYFGVAKVPHDWQHIGLLPEKRQDGWAWPSKPGQIFCGWWGDSELGSALDAGWNIKIHDRLLGVPKGGEGRDPLRKWQEKLVAQYKAAGEDELLRSAIRHILLDTIGSFHRRESVERVIIPLGESLPDWAGPQTPVQLLPGLGFEIERSSPLSVEQQRYQHPEWSSAIWDRQRASMATRMLGVPRGQLLAAATDEIATTQPQPWQDSGYVGAYRLKTQREGPLPTPRTWSEYYTLKQAREEEDSDNG